MSVALIIRTIGVVYINNKQRKKWKVKHKMQNFNILNFGNIWEKQNADFSSPKMK
jgi:hypothetical protein